MSHATPDVGAWEKHTKGIGLKLLQKFGFKGRLGANENGISSAVEVVVRPTNVGLGFGDTVEAANLLVNRKIEAEWKGLDFNETIASKDQRSNENKGWKKSVFRKEDRKVFTAKDFIEKESSKDGKLDYILDMRFSDTGVITQLNNLNDGPDFNKGQFKLGQELLYNINLIAGVEESEVVRASSALHAEERLIDNMTTDAKCSLTAMSSDQKKITKLEGLLTALQSVSVNCPNALIQQLIALHVNFPDEFVIFGCIDMLSSMLRESVLKTSKTWSPCSDYFALIDLHHSCSQLVTHFEQCGQTHLAGRVTTALSDCVEGQFLAPVRRFVAGEWDPIQDGQSGLCHKLFDVLRQVLSERTFNETIDMVLVPKLREVLLTVRLGKDDLCPPHVWLLPWHSVLGSKLDVLHAPLLQKISAYLISSSWQPRDTWVSTELRLWKPLLDKRAWTKLVVQGVVPKLVTAMRTDFRVDPAAQDLSLFTAVILFEGVVPREHLECLLLGEFFGQWLQVLARWVRMPSCDLLEITHWCAGWRGEFPDAMLTASNPQSVSLSVPFAIALDLIESILDVKINGDKGQLARFDDLLARFVALNYESLLQTMTLEHDIQRRVEHLTSNATTSSGQSRDGRDGGSFKEVVEILAEKNGVVFLPKPGRLVEGKQVWQFGNDLIYLEHNNVVAFTTLLGVSSWMPIALDDLLLRNQQQV